MPRYSRSRSRSRSRYDRDYEKDDGVFRLHVGDISENVTEQDLQKAFGKYGVIEEIWLAKNPPCFAFIVFQNKSEADDAQREMDGRSVANSRLRVTWARPRTRGQRKNFDPNMRCYQCGKRGHFSRDCDGGRRRYSRSRSRSRGDRDDRMRRRSRSRSRTRSRSRSRNRSFTRSRTGSRSPRKK